MADRRPHVVIVVVNLPAERDRRVIRECQALEAAGYRASVICPRGPRPLTVLPGTTATTILSFPQPLAGKGVLSFAAEFAWALIAVTARLLGLMLRTRVDAVQACNPPDVFWVVGLLMRALGRPFVFDHHDLSPELYECKAGEPRTSVLWMLRLFERLSWRCATAVVATNESFRELAMNRGGCHPDKVVVVRNGPALAEVHRDRPSPAEPLADTGNGNASGNSNGSGNSSGNGSDNRNGNGNGSGDPRQKVVYVGVINPQDNVEAAVLAAERLVGLRGTDDWELVVAGDGESMSELRRLAIQRGIEDVVRFTGWLEADEVDELLCSASIAIQPDLPSRMAEMYTMAKTVEYVARGVPVVAVDLLETRRTADSAASYVLTGSPDEFAKAIDQLLSDEHARAAMSVTGRQRFIDELAWDHQVKSYIRLWDRLLRPSPNGYNQVSSGNGADAARLPI
ncbi:glycosyltransferase family 4 protein [Plantactinospora soyae]|uniref:Glycosyltransferase involved in cell wall biosynthesis n=1 Tax=Plantactinospora soyae TaxID=1544732 RepID=A0A927M125_9ACTN|nr:glycosyltransferase family 4 protein [Plantactinospora soyae]MBE1484731.1 glycosyltransferase involved in cell wall biosynthesis [Plantactinospora soyae]